MKDAVLGLQYILRAAGASIRPDGQFGPLTAQALSTTSSRVAKQVAEEFRLGLPTVAAASGRVFVPQSVLEQAIAQVTKKRGRDVEPFLRYMLQAENWPAASGLFTEFEGTYQGVGQFSKATWDLGAAKRRTQGEAPPDYSAVRDVFHSLDMAAWYYRDHEGVYKAHRRAVPGLIAGYGPMIGYLYHQQGAPGALHFWRTGNMLYPRQSRTTVATFSQLRTEAFA